MDVPTPLAVALLLFSGQAKGVFARHWLSGTDFPPPARFGVVEARVVWARVPELSDVVATTLVEANLPHLGLACPRTPGEVGIRLPATSNATIFNACQAGLEGRLRSRTLPSTRSCLFVSGVPLAKQFNLATLCGIVNPDLKLITARTESLSLHSGDTIASGGICNMVLLLLS